MVKSLTNELITNSNYNEQRYFYVKNTFYLTF